MQKPYSPACDRNKDPILETLLPVLSQAQHCLEIGSGTGQHAIHFAQALPSLIWQCSDLYENIPGIEQWIAESSLSNLPKPIVLDALQPWPHALNKAFDVVFTANTLHIMSQEAVTELFPKLRQAMQVGGHLFIYGPFNVDNQFTSESNAQFEQLLKSYNEHSGIRDLEWIINLASKQSLTINHVFELPANNKLLHFIC